MPTNLHSSITPVLLFTLNTLDIIKTLMYACNAYDLQTHLPININMSSDKQLTAVRVSSRFWCQYSFPLGQSVKKS